MKLNLSLSNFLNFSRWTSALIVVLGHISGFFQEKGAQSFENPVFTVLSFAEWGAWYAVMVFFALSGFLVGGSVLQEMEARRFDLRVYSIKRISRLWGVLLFALAAGFALDSAGIRFFNANGIYDNALNLFSCRYPVAERLTFPIFFSNAFFLQEILTKTFGSNGPLWSLAYEFWYYFLFPLLMTAALNGSNAKKRLLSAALFILICAFLPGRIVKYFLCWLLGASVWKWSTKLPKTGFWPAAALLAVYTALLYAGTLRFLLAYRGGEFLTDLVFVLLYSNIVFNLRAQQTEGRKAPFEKWNRLFADFSYSVYLAHFPFLLFIFAAASNAFGFPILEAAKGAYLGWAAGALLLTYLYAYGVYFLTERNTDKLRGFLFGFFAEQKRAGVNGRGK